jgi:hypothetical protein
MIPINIQGWDINVRRIHIHDTYEGLLIGCPCDDIVKKHTLQSCIDDFKNEYKYCPCLIFEPSHSPGKLPEYTFHICLESHDGHAGGFGSYLIIFIMINIDPCKSLQETIHELIKNIDYKSHCHHLILDDDHSYDEDFEMIENVNVYAEQ